MQCTTCELAADIKEAAIVTFPSIKEDLTNILDIVIETTQISLISWQTDSCNQLQSLSESQGEKSNNIITKIRRLLEQRYLCQTFAWK